MAYGLKYQLFFTDVENNKFKIEIHKKDFVLDPFDEGIEPSTIIGTGNPVQIKWDADDDIYSPIIGSRCILNFFVTDTAIYDDFYKSGEREYKVKILEYTSFGTDIDQEDLPWNLIDQKWDKSLLGSDVYFNPIWEGFIVNDGYKEAVITTPYEINLEATDGLGILDVFPVPFPSDNTNSKEKLFFYLKEILKLTGHEFNIYISNEIRKSGGAANDTIFHDIEVDRYIFSDDNLILMNAKESLKHILRMTNSRIFQSFGRWYIVNNSSLIDNRITQSTVAPSGADIINETAEPVATPNYAGPDIEIQGDSVYYVGVNPTLTINSHGTEPIKYVWTKPDSTTVTQTIIGQAGFGELPIGVLSLSNNTDVYQVTATDSNNNTDSDTFILNVQERPDSTEVQTGGGSGTTPEPEPVPVNFQLLLTITDNVTDGYISQTRLIRNYAAGQVGDAFSMSFDITSLSGEFTSASQISSLSTTYGTITKSLQGDFIRVTVTGTLPSGGHSGSINVKGAADVQQFTHSYTVSSSLLTNASVSPGSFSATAGSGKAYTKTFSINASSGYKWQGVGNVTVIADSSPYDTLTVSKTNDTTLTVTIKGTIGVNDDSATITVTGGSVGAQVASAITLSPAGPYDIAESSGYFDIKVTSNGNYRVELNRPWATVTPSTGVTGTQTIRVKFTGNSGSTLRRNSINFYATGTNDLITSERINQDSIA